MCVYIISYQYIYIIDVSIASGHRFPRILFTAMATRVSIYNIYRLLYAMSTKG